MASGIAEHARPSSDVEEPPAKHPKLDLEILSVPLSSMDRNVDQAECLEAHGGQPHCNAEVLMDVGVILEREMTAVISPPQIVFGLDPVECADRLLKEGGDLRPDQNVQHNNTDAPSKIPGKIAVTDLSGKVETSSQKTSLCSYFRKKGCNHGKNCRFAHGEEELRPRLDGSWDPTSERAKKLSLGVPGIPKLSIEAAAATVEDERGVVLNKCIVNLSRGWNVESFKKFLLENNISFATAKKRKGLSYGFVGFESPETASKAIKILEGKCVNSKQLKVADAVSRSWESNMTSFSGMNSEAPSDDKDESNAGVDFNVCAEPASICDEAMGDPELATLSKKEGSIHIRDVCDVVTPLAHMPYEEQLKFKKDAIVQVLKRLSRNTRKVCSSGVLLPDWIKAARDHGGLPCDFEGVLASPVVDGYRNKCEFSIGCAADGQRIVGYQLGTFREGITAVGEPTNCRNVSIVAQSYASALQSFVRSSKFRVWNKRTNSGFWRMLTVREGRARDSDKFNDATSVIKEVMLIVQVCPSGIEEEERQAEYEKMAKALSFAASASCPQLPLTVLLVQDHEGVSNAARADAPLHVVSLPECPVNLPVLKDKDSTGCIHDYISNLCFRISPTAFFQVNTLTAERLYTLAGDWACLDQDTVLFDVCCGTGTIGLTLASRVGLVVGIEMNASAVADALINSTINNITNCRFVCGKAEDVMENLLNEYMETSGFLADRLQNSQNTSCEPSEDQETTEDENGFTKKKNMETSNLENKELETSENKVLDRRSSRRPIETAILDGDAAEKGGDDNVKRSGRKLQFKKFVAIVDPPRVGLHPVVIKTLRLHTQLRRLVYISCNPESLLANTVELCSPLPSAENLSKDKGSWRGRPNWRSMSTVGQARQRTKTMPASEPFTPVKAAAVDLFPHTSHCEMVMLLER